MSILESLLLGAALILAVTATLVNAISIRYLEKRVAALEAKPK